jgi:predicted RNase H-like HicB family nuclease
MIENRVKVIVEKSKNGFAAYIPVLPGCIATASSYEKLKNLVQSSIDFHLHGLNEEGMPIPAGFQKSYSLDYFFDAETFLSFYKGIFTKRSLSQITGINESLLSQYASGLKHPRKKQARKIEKGMHALATEILKIKLV